METILINLQCDVPNGNGRIYPRHVVEKMVEKMNKTRPPVVITNGRPDIPYEGIHLDKVVGFVEDAAITEDDQIKVNYKAIQGREDLFEIPHELVTFGVGKVKDHVVDDGYQFHALAMIAKEEPNGD